MSGRAFDAGVSRVRRYIALPADPAWKTGDDVIEVMDIEVMDRVTGMDGTRIAPIAAADRREIETLLDRAFGADRHSRTAYRLRTGLVPEPGASCAAFDAGGALVGSLQSWPMGLFPDADGAAPTPLWLVGPIAVHPDRQGEGIGRAMLRRALAAIDRTGIAAVLIGDPDYYGPFGFDARATGGWTLPGPVDRHRLLARLADGATLPAAGRLGPRR